VRFEPADAAIEPSNVYALDRPDTGIGYEVSRPKWNGANTTELLWSTYSFWLGSFTEGSIKGAKSEITLAVTDQPYWSGCFLKCCQPLSDSSNSLPFRNQNVHYSANSSPPLFPILNHFCKIFLNNILSLKPDCIGTWVKKLLPKYTAWDFMNLKRIYFHIVNKNSQRENGFWCDPRFVNYALMVYKWSVR